MSVLSLTFHAIPSAVEKWKTYTDETLILLAENLMEVEKYILSEVETDMINEGLNTNLLLVFESDDKRTEFLENEFENIRERVESKFGDEVMIFKTHLNPRKTRF